jgi:serine/threonine-protein kinase RsbW
MSVNSGYAGGQQTAVRSLAEVTSVVRQMLSELRPLGYAEKELFGIRLALEEALVNAIKHGNRLDASKQVRIRYHVSMNQFLIEIQDEGNGFDPEGLPDPLSPENLGRPGGRGVFLIRHYMSWVQYNETGNVVTLCKVRATA